MSQVRVDDLQGRTAGIVTRSMAGAVDYLLVGAAVGGIYLGWAALTFLWNPVRFGWPAMPFIWWLLLAGTLMVVYLTGAWATTGRTLGGVLLGTRVVSAGGHRLGLVRSFLRAVFVVIFPIGMFTCAFTPGSRSIHDVPLGTKVVYYYRAEVITAP